jgi:hypothetical protein
MLYATRSMRHNKAIARKALRVIYAIMRDRAPYVETSEDKDAGKPSSAT